MLIGCSMTRTQQFLTCIALVLALSDISAAQDGDFIVLTDNLRFDAPEPKTANEIAQAESVDKLRLAAREEGRKSALAAYRRIESDMRDKGYSIAPDENLSAYDSVVANPASARSLSVVAFGYTPLDLTKGILQQGEFRGINTAPASDGQVHRAQYLFYFDGLGDVVVDELSFATIPNSRISISRPTGNVVINGHPATYSAMRNRNNTKGLTQIFFITDSKLFTVTALSAITRSESEKLEKLISVAEQLH